MVGRYDEILPLSAHWSSVARSTAQKIRKTWDTVNSKHANAGEAFAASARPLLDAPANAKHVRQSHHNG